MHKAIIDCLTGEELLVELTAEELAAHEQALVEAEQKRAAEAAEAAVKEAARQALLDKLGITADEAKLLLG